MKKGELEIWGRRMIARGEGGTDLTGEGGERLAKGGRMRGFSREKGILLILKEDWAKGISWRFLRKEARF